MCVNTCVGCMYSWRVSELREWKILIWHHIRQNDWELRRFCQDSKASDFLFFNLIRHNTCEICHVDNTKK